MTIRTYRLQGSAAAEPLGLIRQVDDFGMVSMELASAPARFFGGRQPGTSVRLGVDAARVDPDPSLGEAVCGAPSDESTMGPSRKAIGQLFAWFLLAEDPQRRLDAKPVSTLAHQASLVRHVLSQANLRRVLIADEVGLGKTVEAGLIIKELRDATPGLRVLYLAPAGLVRNVHSELQRLGLPFRLWVSGLERNAQLSDPMVLASIHRAVHPTHFDTFVGDARWDVLVVDECHHLSDWQKGGGKPTRKYKLVSDLLQRLGPECRLILMSGTPHQGHPERFENLLGLLTRGGESRAELAGRVIYRTKESVRDWDGRPLFPRRDVRPPLIVDLGVDHRAWLEQIYRIFETRSGDDGSLGQARRRALNWRCGQALQWATSSVEAGLGFLVRQAIRAGWNLDTAPLRDAVTCLRPYRRGAPDESLESLFERIAREVGRQSTDGDIEDIEEDPDEIDTLAVWRPDRVLLATAIADGVRLLATSRDARWDELRTQILDGVQGEKVVLFAQPIETVTALCNYLTRIDGRPPAMIVGGQKHEERAAQVEAFWREDGPRFLVSSRAGGEGFNLQVARILVHVDVPWNPMELEQRVGRIHRFMSRRTIQVHTIVVPNSREVDMYDVARAKLRSIAQMLAPDRFEELFARVMALVPPEELADVLVRDALGPLNDRDQAELARLVDEGYLRWERFDREFSAAQRQVRSVPAGQARWSDVARFARDYMSARPVDGGSALRFRFEGGDVIEEPEQATVLEIEGELFASDDYGSMPVTLAGGQRAAPLGLNLDVVSAALRQYGWSPGAPGVAHVRIGESIEGLPATPFGVLAYGRMSFSIEGNSYREVGLELRLFTVSAVGVRVELEGPVTGAFVRALLDGQVRRDPDPSAAALAVWLRTADMELETLLRRPTDPSIRHVVFPVAAAFIT